MSKALKKYIDVDVVAFLEEKMKGNTVSYQGDFEIDKAKIARCLNSDRKEDKVLLWLSRPNGTQCVRESEAFLSGSEEYTTWQYFADQAAGDKYVAFAVELMGVQDGVIRGNLYELDYLKHAEMVKRAAQPAYDVVKTFEDGFVAQVSYDRSSYGYWKPLVEEHGPIVDSFSVPSDKEMLNLVLAEQKRERGKMKEGVLEKTLAAVLDDAQQRSGSVNGSGRVEREKGFSN